VENCPWYVEIAWNFYHGTMSSLQGKTLEYFPGFSTFNIPWMPGITWKIVQLIPWSLERKKKILVYKTEYMHANLLVHYLKTLP